MKKHTITCQVCSSKIKKLAVVCPTCGYIVCSKARNREKKLTRACK